MVQVEEVLTQAIQDLHRRYEGRIASLKMRIGSLQGLVLHSLVQETYRRDSDAALARHHALIGTLLEQRCLLMDERRRLRRRVDKLERLLCAHHIALPDLEIIVSVRPDPPD